MQEITREGQIIPLIDSLFYILHKFGMNVDVVDSMDHREFAHRQWERMAYDKYYRYPYSY